MKKCLQNTRVKQPKKDLGNTVLTLRLTEAEALRFWTLMDLVKTRNSYAGKSDDEARNAGYRMAENCNR